ncbi:MAG: Ig-like domain-containing protein [Anaeromyxobacteraceae bacterium]
MTRARASCAILLLLPTLASAALRDHGPVDPVTGFPAWYRDTSGTATELCLSQTPSPNPAAGGAGMCFPIVPNPQGFPGNFGTEGFYESANSIMTAPGISGRLDLALEGSYSLVTPAHGDEIVFARVRIRIDTTVPGTYTVTHPFGVEVFPNVPAGTRAINFTQDVGLAPGQFDAALAGRVGPFLTWDFLQPGETLTIRNPDGTVKEEYLGDPNFNHTVAGSPFGTNYFRIDGPPGSNLDGIGNSFVQTPFFQVCGKKHIQPIPSPLALTRVSYARDAATAQLDVFASSDAGAQLVVTGANMPAVNMKGDGTGRFYAHVDFPAAATLPGLVTVTNTTDVPPSSKSTGVTDVVFVRNAVFDVSTGFLTVTATTSDSTSAPPAMSALGVGPLAPAGNPWTGSVSAFVANGVPPVSVTVVSSAGGQDVAPVDVVVSAPVTSFAPVAIDDAVTTNENVAALAAVTLNDFIAPPATFARLRIMSAPAHGSAVVSAADPSVLQYSPAPNYFGADAFTYALEDSTGALSNVATVKVTVNRTSIAPIVTNDGVTATVGTPISIPVLANDLAANGTLNPASVVLATSPRLGTATVLLDGTIRYAPVTAGSDTFTYTVRDSFGVVSTPATVTVINTPRGDVLTITRALYTAKSGRWRADGTSNLFGPTITNSVRIHNGPTVASPVIATVPISALGAFTWDSGNKGPAPDASRIVTFESTGGGVVTIALTVN